PGLWPFSPVPLPFHGGEVRSFAHPPGLWPFSPVSLPFHGGEVRFVRAPSRPLAVLPRFTAVSRGRSPLRSRTLPAFGRSPPFDLRFTGEKSVLFAHPPGLRPYSPVSLPFHGGEVRLFAHPPGLWH